MERLQEPGITALKDQSEVPSAQIRILIVDDHVVVREGVRMLIERNPNMLVVGQAGNRAEALAAVSRAHPDIVILELDLGTDNALNFLPDLLDEGRGARVIVLTGIRDAEAHRQAIRFGALGLVMKDYGGEVLFKAIESVHAGEAWIDRRMTADLVVELAHLRKVDGDRARIDSLTGKEREVIFAVCKGLKIGQIAKLLSLSESTVRSRLTIILSKLGLTDRFELALYSYQHGLTALPTQQPVRSSAEAGGPS